MLISEPMTWLVFTLFCAFFIASKDVFLKKVLEKNNVITISFWVYLTTLLILFPLIAFIKIPQLDETFWKACIILIPFEISSILLYFKAIKISPLSSCIPFISLTPIFLILTSFLILKESPDKSGIAGIILTVFGAYALNIHTSRSGFLEPFRSVLKEKGSLLMILVAFIFSISSNLGKIAVNHSSSLFFSVFYLMLFTPLFFFLSLTTGKLKLIPILKHKKLIFLGSIFFAFSSIFHNIAVKMTLVPYFISVKRTSIIFSVIFGAIVFKEENIKEKLLGSIIMIIGIILISLF